jgi:methyl-accepting chemotaxis protein
LNEDNDGMRSTIDFSAARFKHLNWRFRLRNFLDGKDGMTLEQAISHRHCDLGLWFYSEGKQKYGHLAAIQTFEQLHEELHGFIQQIVSLKLAKEDEKAEIAYEAMLLVSEKLMLSLDEAEKIMANKSVSFP